MSISPEEIKVVPRGPEPGGMGGAYRAFGETLRGLRTTMAREVEYPAEIDLPITDTLGSIPAHNAETMPDRPMYALRVPGDPLYPNQFYLMPGSTTRGGPAPKLRKGIPPNMLP